LGKHLKEPKQQLAAKVHENQQVPTDTVTHKSFRRTPAE
jgi:hypothetical protein